MMDAQFHPHGHDRELSRCPHTGMRVIDDPARAQAVLADPERFSSRVEPALDPVLDGADPPDHARSRRAVAPAFAASRLRELEATLYQLADRIVGNLRARDQIDLVRDLADPYTRAALRLFLGLEAELSEPEFSRTVDALRLRMGLTDQADLGSPEIAAPGALLARFDQAFLRTRSTRGPASFPELSDSEALSVARLLLLAATETTRSLLVQVLGVAIRRNQLAHTRASTEWIEEALRLAAPVQLVYRSVRADLGAPEVVQVSLVGAPLHGEWGESGESGESRTRAELRVHGTEVGLAFGYGPHFCLGAKLALIEVEAVLAAIATHVETLEFDGDATIQTRVLHGSLGVVEARCRVRWKPHRP